MGYYVKDEEGYWDRYPERFSGMRDVNEHVSPSTMHVLGDENDDGAPAALIFTMPPGFELVRHGHECERFEIILEGSMEIETGITLHPGDIMRVEPGEMYGPHIAGPEGCRTLEVFSTLEGARWAKVDMDGDIVLVDTAAVEDIKTIGY